MEKSSLKSPLKCLELKFKIIKFKFSKSFSRNIVSAECSDIHFEKITIEASQ